MVIAHYVCLLKSGKCIVFSNLRLYRHLNHAVQLTLKQMVCLGDVGEFVAVRNQWRGVNLARFINLDNTMLVDSGLWLQCRHNFVDLSDNPPPAAAFQK